MILGTDLLPMAALYPGAEHFYVHEVACRCGCGFGRHPGDVNPHLVELLEAIRRETGHPLIPNSVCRCPMHNRAVGGVENSVHTLGEAADLRAIGGERKYGVVRAAFAHGARGVGVYDNFTHVDVHDGSVKFRPSTWSGKG